MSEHQPTRDGAHPGFQSGVAGLKLCDILELKSRQGFHGLLVVQHEKQTAKIYFSQGKLQQAITPGREGEEAIREVLRWPGGKIKVLPQMTCPHRTIEKDLETLLIETGHRTLSEPLAGLQPLPVPPMPPVAPVPTPPVAGESKPLPLLRLFSGLALLGFLVTMGIYLLNPSIFPFSKQKVSSGAVGSLAPAFQDSAATYRPNLFASPEKILTLQGSNTIGSELAPSLAREFLSSKGATQINVQQIAAEELLVSGYFPKEQRARAIEIRAHGSSTSFAGLKAHVCDIGMASRRIKEKERLELELEGDLTAANAEYVLAMDGVAVVVHPSNPIESLSIEQIAGLFSGAISDWADIPQSGLQGAVKIYARDDKSGTYDTFKSLVLGPQQRQLSERADRYEDSQHLSNRVAGDPQGIGFIGLPYISPSKAVAVAEEGTKPIFPTAFTIATEDYPLSRRLYLYLPPKSPSTIAREFMAFATSDQGQITAEKVGFVKLSIFAQKRSLAGQEDVPPEYAAMAREARRLSVNFRFASGGTGLDNKAVQDLSRIVDYLKRDSNRNSGISLFGFADNLGQYEKNCEISRDRARAVEEALAAFGVFSTSTLGFCDRIPIASNQSSSGRNKNRRVEVWVN